MKRKGFTLVELLAVIAVLAVILLIVTPKVIDTINNTKEKAFINSAKRLAKAAESEKINNINDNSIIECSSLAIIDSSNYKNCSISFQDGIAVVNIEGNGRYNNMKICNATKSNASISYGECNGTLLCTKGTTSSYEPKSDINLEACMSNSKIRMIDTYLGFGNSVFDRNGELIEYNPNYGYVIKGDFNYDECYNALPYDFRESFCSNDLLTIKQRFDVDSISEFVSYILNTEWVYYSEIEDFIEISNENEQSICTGDYSLEYNSFGSMINDVLSEIGIEHKDISEFIDKTVVCLETELSSLWKQKIIDYGIDLVNDDYYPFSSITFYDTSKHELPSNVLNSSNKIDVSSMNNGSIYAYFIESSIVDDIQLYDVYIASNDSIVLPKDSTALFSNCIFLNEIDFNDSIDISKLEYASYMFSNCENLEKIYVSSNWNTKNITHSYNMFSNCENIVGGDGTTYNSEYIDKSKAYVGTGGYFTCSEGSTCTSDSYLLTLDLDGGSIENNMSGSYSGIVTINIPMPSKSGYVFTGWTIIDGTPIVSGNKVTMNGSTALKARYTTHNNYLSSSWKDVIPFSYNQINSISFYNTSKIAYANQPNTRYAGDVSTTQNGSIKLYYSSSTYDIYIVSDSDILFPINSSYLFSDKEYSNRLSNLESINFNNSVDTSNVTNMSNMFYYCENLEELDLSGFDTSNVTNMEYIFFWCTSLEELDISSFDTSNVTNMRGMFFRCSCIEELDLSSFNTSKVTDMSYMFDYCRNLKELNLDGWDTHNVTNMSEMFFSCESFEVLDLNEFDTSNVTSMTTMFYSCIHLVSLYINNWDTRNVTSMCHHDGTYTYTVGMFQKCQSLLNLNLDGWDVTSVKDMQYMFAECTNLEELDLSNFNTNKVTNMRYMFAECINLRQLNISNFDTSNVTNMYKMFYRCESLEELDVSSFDTSKVTNMSYMFYHCESLEELNLSSFDTSKVTDMSYMFEYCRKLSKIYVSDKWSTSKVTSSSSMFYSDTLLVGGNGTTYSSSYTSSTYARIDRSNYKGYFTNINTLTFNVNVTNANPSYGSVSGGGSYSGGTSVTLTATPNEGYRFAGWYSNNKLITYSKSYSFKLYADTNLEARFEEGGSGTPTWTLAKANGASYQFVRNSNGYYESNNKGIHNSTAVSVITVEVPDYDTSIKLHLINYGESSYDYGIIGNLDGTLSTSSTADSSYKWSGSGKQSSSEQIVTFDNVSAGTHTIYIKYRKDGSVNSGNDSLQFKISFNGDDPIDAS